MLEVYYIQAISKFNGPSTDGLCEPQINYNLIVATTSKLQEADSLIPQEETPSLNVLEGKYIHIVEGGGCRWSRGKLFTETSPRTAYLNWVEFYEGQ